METIGRYRITRLLGQGGMGVVYAAHDDRLDRPVAVKVIRPDALADEYSLERFRREARAAARVSHPHICPLYELDEDNGRPFLVMELLEGETLAARLERGPLTLTDTLAIATPMLEALAALHRRGIVHRDLKPANVFLTPGGVKLVDFGLAQPLSDEDQTREMRLTGQGTIVGTPQYMAPEQLFKGEVDERADVFSAGTVIYEMLAGRPAFAGQSLPEIVHAVGYLDPPPLDGSAEVAAVEGVLRKALHKNSSDRVGRAEVLAEMLRDAIESPVLTVAQARPRLARFVALPLRVLKPDPETDFLAFSIPDAVSVALATLASVVVRSPQTAWSGTNVDVRTIGRDLAVDVVLTGTILRAGQRVRVSAQLLDAAAGTLIWSDVAQAPIEDLFQLQDTLTDRIVASLALPLSRRDRQSLARQAPSSAEAYELYLRANQLMTNPEHWTEACGLYERAISLDPGYALAWARLGRARRLLAKYGGPDALRLDEAEDALRRALELNPDLSIAHDLSAYVEAELGRAPEAMERLLHRVAIRRHDPELLAGLVTTCRYAGLPEESLKAHERAVAVDPQMRTTVTWSYLLLGDYARAIATDQGSPPYSALVARAIGGDPNAIAEFQHYRETAATPGARLVCAAHAAAIEGKVQECLDCIEVLRATGFNDPEGWYVSAFLLARTGAVDPALTYLAQALQGGYGCAAALGREAAWLQHHGLPRFDELRATADAMTRRARDIYESADGPAVLAIRPPSSRSGRRS